MSVYLIAWVIAYRSFDSTIWLTFVLVFYPIARLLF